MLLIYYKSIIFDNIYIIIFYYIKNMNKIMNINYYLYIIIYNYIKITNNNSNVT